MSTPDDPPRRRQRRALGAFLAARTGDGALRSRLTALSAAHFEAELEEVNWGHAGALDHHRARLRETADMALREGEQPD